MEINVELLGHFIKLNEKQLKEEKNQIKKEKYNSKIVEFSHFVENEIHISRLIDKKILPNKKNGFFRFLTVQEYNMIKICEVNQKIMENEIEDNIFFKNKRYLVLKYKNIDDNENNSFINSFINISENKPIVMNLTIIYKYFIENILFLGENNIRLIDFSPNNLSYSTIDSCIYMKNFQKCYKKVNLNEIYDNYIMHEKNIDVFIRLVENTEYFGNKHFDLYFAKQIIDKKELFVVLNNLDNIIEDYIDNLYFLRFFSKKIKNEMVLSWKKYIKSMNIFDKNKIKANIIAENDWKLYLSLFLKNSHSHSTIWETFCINSLFLNISITLLKFFEIENKNSILHQYIQFLFSNLDIIKSIDMLQNERKYNNFINSFENEINLENLDNYKITCLNSLSEDKLHIFYNYLIKNCCFF
jgi:hypothetical protein